jgi:tetratricopeptide (TPR) repeat protein
MPEELFRSADLLVRKVGNHGAACCVVTFDSFTDFRTLDRPGFGEFFLDRAGIDAIHVLSRDNDWYQYPDIPAAMACVRAAAQGYARVVTYGSSMGAYAALRLGGLAGAHAALALSPQFTIDPAIVPWETRWPESAKLYTPLWERTLPLPALPEAYIVYDPVDNDRKHAALYAKHLQFKSIRLPLCGHPVTGFLADIGLLQVLIRAVCRRDFDPAKFEAQACAERHRSPQYLINLALRTRSWRQSKRIALVREAVRLAPGDAGVLCYLAMELSAANEFDEALTLHRRTLEIAPGHPNLLLQYSRTLERSGDLAAAIAVMEQVEACSGGSPIYRPRLERLQARAAKPGARWDPAAILPAWLKTRRSRPVRPHGH